MSWTLSGRGATLARGVVPSDLAYLTLPGVRWAQERGDERSDVRAVGVPLPFGARFVVAGRTEYRPWLEELAVRLAPRLEAANAPPGSTALLLD